MYVQPTPTSRVICIFYLWSQILCSHNPLTILSTRSSIGRRVTRRHIPFMERWKTEHHPPPPPHDCTLNLFFFNFVYPHHVKFSWMKSVALKKGMRILEIWQVFLTSKLRYAPSDNGTPIRCVKWTTLSIYFTRGGGGCWDRAHVPIHISFQSIAILVTYVSFICL